MASIITRVPDLPVVIIKTVEPFNPMEDTKTNMAEAAKLKKELGRPVYRIIDITDFDLTFSDMVAAMGAERKHEGGTGDPEVTTCFVGSGELVELGTKALAEQDQYGKAKVKLFTSVENALAFIREDVSS